MAESVIARTAASVWPGVRIPHVSTAYVLCAESVFSCNPASGVMRCICILGPGKELKILVQGL